MSSSNSNVPRRSTRAERDATVMSSGRFGDRDRSPLTKYFDATPCEGPGCRNTIPAGLYPAKRTRAFCSDTCRARSHNPRTALSNTPVEGLNPVAPTTRRNGSRRPEPKYFEAAPCEGPGCTNIVPAGLYWPNQKRRFCSRTCFKRDKQLGWVVGTCMCGCGQPVLGEERDFGKRKFAGQEHYCRFAHESGLEETEVFRPLIERYMEEDAKVSYSPGSLVSVQSSLVKLFRFAVQKGFSDVNEFRPSTITQLIKAEEARGVVDRNYVALCSSFFNYLIENELYKHPNPVIPRRHNRNTRQREPRPYTDPQMAKLWPLVQAGGQYELMLAFWIGTECGLRVGEVANIRLADIDAVAQTISVRLPTKNGRTRSVPFHDGVKEHLALWLEHRSHHCPSDHLLHNTADRPFGRQTLIRRFKNLLRMHDELAGSFKFHRLRHTWATRLINNGMELAVLMVLGGWKSLSGVQCYIRILPATVRRVYQAAYKQMQEQQDSVEGESVSLLDFAAMVTEKPVTSLKQAA